MKRFWILGLTLYLCSCSTKDTEWISLFNGEDLTGWHIYGSNENANTWLADGEVLVFDPALRTTAKNANLVTDKVYEDFELSLEWMISENGNSGLFWGVIEDTKYEHPYQTGPEVQILDDNWTEYIEERGDIQRAGSIFNIMAPSKVVSKPSGQWNSYLLHIDQTNNAGWLDFNGERVLEFPVHGSEWTQLIKDSAFNDWEGFGRARNGRIALQDHGHKVAFRKIKIRELNIE